MHQNQKRENSKNSPKWDKSQKLQTISNHFPSQAGRIAPDFFKTKHFFPPEATGEHFSLSVVGLQDEPDPLGKGAPLLPQHSRLPEPGLNLGRNSPNLSAGCCRKKKAGQPTDVASFLPPSATLPPHKGSARQKQRRWVMFTGNRFTWQILLEGSHNQPGSVWVTWPGRGLPSLCPVPNSLPVWK